MASRVEMHRTVSTFSFVMVFLLSSCSTLTSFGYKKEKLYVQKPVALESETSDKSPSLWYLALGLGTGCFDREATPEGEIISFTWGDSFTSALNYFYHNKASWDIETKINGLGRSVLMNTSSEVTMMFKTSSCEMKRTGFLFDSYIPVTSYYLIKVSDNLEEKQE